MLLIVKSFPFLQHGGRSSIWPLRFRCQFYFNAMEDFDETIDIISVRQPARLLMEIRKR